MNTLNQDGKHKKIGGNTGSTSEDGRDEVLIGHQGGSAQAASGI